MQNDPIETSRNLGPRTRILNVEILPGQKVLKLFLRSSLIVQNFCSQNSHKERLGWLVVPSVLVVHLRRFPPLQGQPRVGVIKSQKRLLWFLPLPCSWGCSHRYCQTVWNLIELELASMLCLDSALSCRFCYIISDRLSLLECRESYEEWTVKLWG